MLLGSSAVDTLKLGSSQVDKLYLGTDLAWSSTPAPYNLLTDWTTEPLHGWWASDPAWTPPADGALVASWRNGGSVGGDATQTTDGAKPTFDASHASYGNLPVVAFGGDDVLFVDPANVNQRYWVVVIGNLGSTGVAERFFGIGANTIRGFGDTAGNAWTINAATAVSAGTSNNNPHLFVGDFNGASSVLTIDGTSTVSGSAGAGAMALLSLGAGNAGASTFANYLTGNIHALLFFTSDPTAQAEWTEFIDYVENTVGIAVA